MKLIKRPHKIRSRSKDEPKEEYIWYCFNVLIDKLQEENKVISGKLLRIFIEQVKKKLEE